MYDGHKSLTNIDYRLGITANTSKDTDVRVTWSLPHITQPYLMLKPCTAARIWDKTGVFILPLFPKSNH
jgi:hypothetical protein